MAFLNVNSPLVKPGDRCSLSWCRRLLSSRDPCLAGGAGAPCWPSSILMMSRRSMLFRAAYRLSTAASDEEQVRHMRTRMKKRKKEQQREVNKENQKEEEKKTIFSQVPCPFHFWGSDSEGLTLRPLNLRGVLLGCRALLN